MRVLIFGDIVGRYGRAVLARELPGLRDRYRPDFIVGNSENLTHGRGATAKHLDMLRALGFDGFTGGNHTFDRLEEVRADMEREDSVQIRALNYVESRFYRVPGRGHIALEKAGKRLLVVNLMSSLFLRDALDNPFLRVDSLLESLSGDDYDGIIVDFHRETTAEMACMGAMLDGRVSVVYGTHTHIQTNDEQVLAGGTGMITDVGMTGPLDTSIGEPFATHLPRFLSGVSFFGERDTEIAGRGVLCAVITDIEGGRCTGIEKIRIVVGAAEIK